MFLGGNSSGRAQTTISPRLLRPMCGIAQSSLRIALPKKPSGSAGRSWRNHRIHVLKAKALLFSSDCGRGFGSMFHHQNSKNQPFSVGFFSRIPASAGADSGHGLASAIPPNPAFSPPPTPLCSPFSLLVSRACARSLPVLARVLRLSVVVGNSWAVCKLVEKLEHGGATTRPDGPSRCGDWIAHPPHVTRRMTCPCGELGV